MNYCLSFEYRGCHFTCSAVETENSYFQPLVVYQNGVLGQQQGHLPVDTSPYITAAEALRHAQQQAVRWVHDQEGEGQGQF